MAGAEITQPFLCRDAIDRLCKISRRSVKPIKDICEPVLNESVHSLIKSNFSAIYQFSTKSGVRVVILGKHVKNTRLLVDFRHLECEDYLNLNTVYWIIDDATKALLKETQDRNEVPKKNLHTKIQTQSLAHVCGKTRATIFGRTKRISLWPTHYSHV